MCAVVKSDPKGHQGLTLHPRYILCSPQGRVEGKKKRLRESERKQGRKREEGGARHGPKSSLG